MRISRMSEAVFWFVNRATLPKTRGDCVAVNFRFDTVGPFSQHFYTTRHASDHPSKAKVINEMALEVQTPAVAQLWKEVLTEVAAELDDLNVRHRAAVKHDPLSLVLGTLPRPDRKRPDTMPRKRPHNGRASSSSSAAAAAVASSGSHGGGEGVGRGRDGGSHDGGGSGGSRAGMDPFRRRKLPRKSYWNIGGESSTAGAGEVEGVAGAASAAVTAAEAAAASTESEYMCDRCGSQNTTYEPVGGASRQVHKGETWGSKDRPELIILVTCHACGSRERVEH
ncbi:unnamed protein product [Phaeothamnion confervicola]